MLTNGQVDHVHQSGARHRTAIMMHFERNLEKLPQSRVAPTLFVISVKLCLSRCCQYAEMDSYLLPPEPRSSDGRIQRDTIEYPIGTTLVF